VPGGDWLIYALGGGLGHITRGLALARAAAARGHTVTIIANSELAPFAMAAPAHPAVELRVLDAALDPAGLAKLVTETVTQQRWAVLVVDTFPRGIVGDLAPLLSSLKVPRVLVHRCLNPEYVAAYNVAGTVDVYDRLLVPGEPAAFSTHPKAVLTAPWLVRDCSELPEFAAARKLLAAATPDELRRRLVLLSGCGRPPEITRMAQRADRLRAALSPEIIVRFAAPVVVAEAAISHFPSVEAFPGVDVLVGAGGYNTVHEARATATPLLAFAQPRRYDLQHERLLADELIAESDDLAQRVRDTLSRTPPACQRQVRAYENGVHAAVLAIEALL
jgi:hypothetical protein